MAIHNIRPRPRVPRALREQLFLRSGGICEAGCGTPIAIDTFHVAHLRAHASGGALVLENLAAWCTRCNYAQGAVDVADTRLIPREWQLEALDPVVARIISDGAATVSAAPGAGKTIFAGLVFEALEAADIVDRMVVLAPRVALVSQWHKALVRARHVELKPFRAVERLGQAGVVNTYQSLTIEELNTHRDQAKRARTLLVLDEVHHVGERDGETRPMWAQRVSQLAGVVDRDLHVSGVLNLSGTLWRSKPGERISTVRYVQGEDGRLTSLVDYRIDAERLIQAGELRPIDLYRLGALVSIADFAELEVKQSDMADLDEKPARATLRGLAQQQEWRAGFIGNVLERLEIAHRSLGGHHAKALIVAASQADARLYQAEINQQMDARGFQPLAEIAISDEKDAPKVLADFAAQKRVGVLCTVDMAGEGFDCPDICVIGYATHKLTALYIRQVVARAMRVTAYEREHGIIPAAVVVPDVPVLIRTLAEYLVPIMHELVAPPEPREPREGPGGPLPPRYRLEDAELTGEKVSVAHDGELHDLDGRLVREMTIAVEALNMPGVYVPRYLIASRNVTHSAGQSRPFDLPTADETRQRSLSTEENCSWLQQELKRLEGWWALHGDSMVAAFAGAVNDSQKVKNGQRPSASLAQLQAMYGMERQQIRAYCERTGKRPPRGC